MGLDSYMTRLTVEQINNLKREKAPDGDPVKIVILGYQELLLDPEDIETLFGQGAVSKLVPRPNSERLMAVHGSVGLGFIPTLDSFFDLVGGVQIDIIDFKLYEGTEIVHDLGIPIPEDLTEKYDMVIDGGTLEHIFNVGEAFHNVAKLTRPGGVVIHFLPMNSLNHGFHNFSPTLFYDFYEDIGFSVEHFRGVYPTTENGKKNWKWFEAPRNKRFKLDQECYTSFVAKRHAKTLELVYPVQGRYRDKSNYI